MCQRLPYDADPAQETRSVYKYDSMSWSSDPTVTKIMTTSLE